jgi:hypothetical protein
MPDSEWEKAAMHVLSALQSLEKANTELKAEVRNFTRDAINSAALLQQQERDIQDLRRAFDRMIEERADYRESMAVRLTTIEQHAKSREAEANRHAALVSALVGGGVSIITAIIAATWAKS